MIEKSKSPEKLRKRTIEGLMGSFAVGLGLDRRREAGRSTDQIDKKMAAKLHSDYQSLPEAATDESVGEYAELYDQAQAWHGTGRYQYDKDGEIVDILSSICKQGDLVPSLDEYDVINGKMMSISLARSRMYARAYADIHGAGQDEKHRYGGAGFWATYVGSRLPVDMLMETKPWRRVSREKIRSNRENRTSGYWGAKVHMGFTAMREAERPQYTGLFTPFYTGSDIDGNYPVLFGVQARPQEAQIAHSIARHEIRTHQAIALDDISHVEVPQDKIADTDQLFKGYGVDIPIMAIETGEEYCSRLAFTDLVYPSGSSKITT